VVFKPIHKTLKFASFNHHPSHPQAHSSSKKCAHLNQLHLHHSASNNKLQLFLHLPHLFFVNDHHNHPLQLLPKQLSENLLLYQYHHDQSSLNVSQLHQPDHVISSLNVGFHMVLLLNEKPLFKKLKQLKVILHHATLLSNTKQFKFVLFANSNDWVLLKKAQPHIFNDMVLNYLMPKPFSNKLVLLVLLKIFHPQLVLQVWQAHHHSAKKHHSVLVVLVVLDLVVLNLVVLLVENLVVHHSHQTHLKAHQPEELVVSVVL
jgi:hypothetical protein